MDNLFTGDESISELRDKILNNLTGEDVNQTKQPLTPSDVANALFTITDAIARLESHSHRIVETDVIEYT